MGWGVDSPKRTKEIEKVIEKLECTCIEAYTVRKMRDPNCCACSCDHNDLVEQLAKANEQIQKLSARNAELVEPLEKCPITRRDLFMVIDGEPTYGGPFDSYTIPVMQGKPDEKWHERELAVERFDHDEGGWSDSEIIPVRVISEECLYELDEQLAKANERVKELEKGNKSCAVAIREIIAKGAIGPLLVTGDDLDKIVNKFAIEQQINVGE